MDECLGKSTLLIRLITEDERSILKDAVSEGEAKFAPTLCENLVQLDK